MIVVKDISKKYKKRVILNKVSFEANPGECVAIVGANGCGKTTLLNIIAGAAKPDSGSILLWKEEALRNRKSFLHHIGYIPQDNPLISGLSVMDNLRFWYCNGKRDLKKDLNSGLPAMFGLDSYLNFPVEKLSGGMKKRLSIVCSLTQNPSILILDEPGASLDVICKQDIKNYLKFFIKKGGTVIITSHETNELDFCNKMFLLTNGNLLQLPDCPTGDSLLERMRSQHA